MRTKDFILLGAGYAAGRLSKKMSAGPIGAVRKISKEEAKEMAEDMGLNLKKDFFTLNRYEVDKVLEIAKMKGYKKAKNAPGSKARMFWYYLQRIK